MFREMAKLEGKDDASIAEYFKYIRQDMGVRTVWGGFVS
jgi:hypothetical protein